jgi:hypothetical protein
VYRGTEFVKNSYGFEHDHIINRGMPVEEISKASNRRITPVTIAHDNIKPGEPIHNGILKENRLMIYKPAIAPAVPKSPVVIKALLEKASAVAQQKIETGNKELIKRQKAAAQQTMKSQQLKAENSTQEKFHLEQAASYEADPKKKAEFQAEAEIQTMKAQQAQNHVVNIKQWKPAAEQKPVVMPQSKVMPQPSAENHAQVQSQVRTQVQNEARMEQQRQPAMEEMIRSHAGQQNNAGHPQEKKR